MHWQDNVKIPPHIDSVKVNIKRADTSKRVEECVTIAQERGLLLFAQHVLIENTLLGSILNKQLLKRVS